MKRLLLALFLVACGNASLDLGPGGPGGPGVPGEDGGSIASADARTPDAAPPEPTAGEDAGRTPTFEEEARALGARWKWLDPLPSGEPMNGVAGTSLRDLWYVGEQGTALHWDGKLWRELTAFEPVAFEHAWSPVPGEVWAFGIDRAGKGRTFRISASGALIEDRALFGVEVQAFGSAGPGRAVAVCARGEVRLWNGSRWRVVREATGNWLRGVHAFSDREMVAVGDAGEILRFDGEAWTRQTVGSGDRNPFDETLQYEGVWGRAPDDVWAVASGKSLAFAHYDGTRWSVVDEHSSGCGDGSSVGRTWWAAEGGLVRDARRPFGPVLAGTGRSGAIFRMERTCAFRLDGLRWSAEPFSWTRTLDGGLSAEHPHTTPAVAALDGWLLAGNRVLDPSLPLTPNYGPNARWRVVRRDVIENAYRESAIPARLFVDRHGQLWNSQTGVWTSAAWSPLGAPIPTNFRHHLFARGANDVWLASHFSGRIEHWNGESWAQYSLPGTAVVSLEGNDEDLYVYSTTTDNAAVLRRFRGAALVAETELPTRGDGSVLAPSREGGAALVVYRGKGDQESVECRVASWDGRSDPVVVATIERCVHPYISDPPTLHRLSDGRVAVLTRRLLATWDGAHVTRYIEADTYKESFRGIAPIDGERYWLLTDDFKVPRRRSAIEVWNARTGARAFARHATELSSIVSNSSGEAWAGGPGRLLHFVPEPKRPLPPK